MEDCSDGTLTWWVCVDVCTVTWQHASRSYVGVVRRWRSCWRGNRSWTRKRGRLSDWRRRQCTMLHQDEHQLWMILSCQVRPTHVTPLTTVITHAEITVTLAGPRVWNSLPTQLRESDITLGQFLQALKTHLFGHIDSCSTEWQCFLCAVYKLA